MPTARTPHRLKCEQETLQARLYRDEQGRKQWVPKSVCHNVVEPGRTAGRTFWHLVDIEVWWLNANPFPQRGAEPGTFSLRQEVTQGSRKAPEDPHG